MRTRFVVIAVAMAALSGGAAAAGDLRPAERLSPPPKSFTIAATGDILTEELVNLAAGRTATGGARYDFAPLLAPHAAMVRWADLAICHMETPIGRPGERAGVYGKTTYGLNKILSPYEIAAGVAASGFDRCSTASNHSNDLGADGITSTLDALDDAGLSHTGTARTPSEASVSTFVVEGVRIAHLSYTRANNSPPPEGWRLTQATSPAAVAADVAAARAQGAAVVILSIHLQQEMLTAPTPADRAFDTELTRLADVDLILHHGPHVVQPVERVNGTLVYWSLGNHISGMGMPNRGKYADPRTLDGLMATVRFTQRPDGSLATEPHTVLLCTMVDGRTVWPGIAALRWGSAVGALRPALQACVDRSLPVVGTLN